MKLNLLGFFFFLHSYASSSIECSLLQQDLGSLQNIVSALVANDDCENAKALAFPLSRIKNHFEILVQSRPDWILINDCISLFGIVNSSLLTCQIPNVISGLTNIIDKGKNTHKSYCSN